MTSGLYIALATKKCNESLLPYQYGGMVPYHTYQTSFVVSCNAVHVTIREEIICDWSHLQPETGRCTRCDDATDGGNARETMASHWLHCTALYAIILLLATHSPSLLVVSAVTLGNGSLQNFRPVQVGGVPTRFYRAATLDSLSQEDARALLDGTIFKHSTNPRPVDVVIDLRNRDEIDKNKATRTQAAVSFYERLEDSSSLHTWVHVPILKDVDAFWDEAITRMPPSDRFWGTLKTVTTAGALDRAAARNLEQEGLSLLYTITLATSQRNFRKALKVCALSKGPVVFHCQKGKDRTGLLAMLLQSYLGSTKDEIIETYAESGALIGETQQYDNTKESESGTFIDWSRFRGSPPSAMAKTLEWVEERYGSVENYLLDEVGVEKEWLAMLSNPSVVKQ